jgi:apolipoprotein N-acyltransferase
MGGIAWVAMEMVIARMFTGFPWNLLGASQYKLTPLIQIASWTGIYGVSFLVVWTSLSLACGGLQVLRRPDAKSVWIAEVFLPVLTVAILFNIGVRVMRMPEPADRKLQAMLVQPSIPQTLIWDTARDAERFSELVRLSTSALTNQTDVLIWPEAAIPNMLRYDDTTFEAVTNLAATHHVWFILGSDDMQPKRGSIDPKEREYYNSAFLVNPKGELESRYVKRNLVIFGEYVPFRPVFKWFTPIEGGFTRGERAEKFVVGDSGIRTSILICFEDTFPWLGREASKEGSDIIINITNNGWFEESAAQWQHAASAVFRAVENGIPLLRCSNNGLTCWVDARGRIRQLFRDAKESVYGSGFLNCEIPLPAADSRPAPTFYQLYGDVFGWSCVAATVLAVLLARKHRAEEKADIEVQD